jgi:hypothetical protein
VPTNLKNTAFGRVKLHFDTVSRQISSQDRLNVEKPVNAIVTMDESVTFVCRKPLNFAFH